MEDNIDQEPVAKHEMEACPARRLLDLVRQEAGVKYHHDSRH